MARLDDMTGQADSAGRTACTIPWHGGTERKTWMSMVKRR
jgi:hypothetical protein